MTDGAKIKSNAEGKFCVLICCDNYDRQPWVGFLEGVVGNVVTLSESRKIKRYKPDWMTTLANHGVMDPSESRATEPLIGLHTIYDVAEIWQVTEQAYHSICRIKPYKMEDCDERGVWKDPARRPRD